MSTWATGKPRPTGGFVWTSAWGLGTVPLQQNWFTALPLLPAPLGGPGWLLAVWSSWSPGSPGDGAGEVGVLPGWDWRGGWGEQLFCSSDAPFSTWRPLSPHFRWVGGWSIPPPSQLHTPQGPPWGQGSSNLFRSQNKCYCNPRKIFLCPSVPLWGRDNGGSISQAWVTVLRPRETHEGGLGSHS